MPSFHVVVFAVLGFGSLAEPLRAQSTDVESDSRRLWQVSAAQVEQGGGVVRQRWSVVADESGWLSVDLRSTQLDPLLRLLAPDGAERALDDDGGVGWNAHMTVQVEEGERLEFESISQGPHRGELELELRRGVHPPPEGPALREALARFQLGRGSFQAELGFPVRAAQELNAAGEAFHALDLHRERLQAYASMLDAVLSLPDDAPERALFELVARAQLVAALATAGDDAAASEHLAVAERLASESTHPAAPLLIARGRALLLANSDDLDFEPAVRASDEFASLLSAQGDDAGAARAQLTLIGHLLRRARVADAQARLPAARALVDGLDDSKLTAQLLIIESRAARTRGDQAEAGALARLAAERAVTKLQRAEALLLLGTAHDYAGRFGDALSCFDEALALAQELEAAELRAAVLHSTATVALLLEDNARGLALLRESLKLTDPIGGKLNVLDRSLHMAYALLKTGRVDEAQELMEVVSAEPTLTVVPEIEHRLQTLRVSLAEARGDVEAARLHARVALEQARRMDSPRLLARALAIDARSLLGAARTTDALAVALESLEHAHRAGDPDVLTHSLVTLSRARLASGDLAGAAADFAEAEATLLDEWAAQLDARWAERLRAVVDSERLSRLGQDLTAAQLAQATEGSEEWDTLFALGLQRADRWKGRDLLSRLRAPASNASREPGSLLRELEARLSVDGSQLIHFAEGGAQLYAYVLDGGERRHEQLGDLAAVGAEIDTFLEHIARPESLGSVEQVAAGGARLHARLVTPLGLSAVESELVVIDSGVLAGLPLEALVVDAPSEFTSFEQLHFLLDDRRVTYAPSASALVLAQHVLRQPRSSDLVVIADPQFEGASDPLAHSATLRSTPSLEPLPGTRSEALAIARSYLTKQRSQSEIDSLLSNSQSGGLRLDSGGLRLRLGDEATRPALLEVVEGAAIVHLATHGVQDSREPRRSALALTPTGGDAGRLYLGEILDLQLSAELAVLSACETASGANRHGEGTRSLAWSFLRAGAEAVVASHWQVDDRESEVLMRAFYEEYFQSHDASRALHNARLSLRHASAIEGGFLGVGRGKRLGARPVVRSTARLAGHPFFWASFVHVRAREEGAFRQAPVER